MEKEYIFTYLASEFWKLVRCSFTPWVPENIYKSYGTLNISYYVHMGNILCSIWKFILSNSGKDQKGGEEKMPNPIKAGKYRCIEIPKGKENDLTLGTVYNITPQGDLGINIGGEGIFGICPMSVKDADAVAAFNECFEKV